MNKYKKNWIKYSLNRIMDKEINDKDLILFQKELERKYFLAKGHILPPSIENRETNNKTEIPMKKSSSMSNIHHIISKKTMPSSKRKK